MFGGCETLTTIRSKPIILPEVLEIKPPAAVVVEHFRGNVVTDADDHYPTINENDSQLQLENRQLSRPPVTQATHQNAYALSSPLKQEHPMKPQKPEIISLLNEVLKNELQRSTSTSYTQNIRRHGVRAARAKRTRRIYRGNGACGLADG